MAAVDAEAETRVTPTFQKHIEDMRGLTLCKICLRPFYEPFTLACGHTYCYSCLRDWLHGPREQRAEKGCPDCRQKIEAEPSPNYTLRDLVHMFVNRVELLPDDESIEEHERGKSAEAKVLADDKKAGGLFRGMFKRTRLPLLGFDRAFHDQTDGVDRCPKCMWEMEDGECNSCGWPRSDPSDDDYDSTDDVAELHAIHHFHPLYEGALGGHHYRYSDGATDQSTDDFSGEEDEHDTDLDSFIDDDDYPTETDHDTDTYNTFPPTGSRHIEISSDDDDEDLDADAIDINRGHISYPPAISGRMHPPQFLYPTASRDDHDDEGSESGTVTTAVNYDDDTDTTPRRPLRHWPEPQDLDNDLDDDLDDDDLDNDLDEDLDNDLDEDLDNDLDEDLDNDLDEDDEDDDDQGVDGGNDDSDDSDAVIQAGPISRGTKRARSRRIIESDDEEDDFVSAYDSLPPSSTTTTSTTSGTAQSTALRLNRLRVRRAHHTSSRQIANHSSPRRMPPPLAYWANRRGTGSPTAQAPGRPQSYSQNMRVR